MLFDWELCNNYCSSSYKLPLSSRPVLKWMFIQAISITPLQVHYYSKALPTTAQMLCRSFAPKYPRQLRVKDLPKVPTWRLERDSNLQSSWKRHRICQCSNTPHVDCRQFFVVLLVEFLYIGITTTCLRTFRLQTFRLLWLSLLEWWNENFASRSWINARNSS